jgi:hypothetical protein
MTEETKVELILNAIRWVSNILVEILSNYGSINQEGREHLRSAIASLHKAEDSYKEAK